MRARRGLAVVGSALLLGGVLLTTYVTWELWGTTVLARREHDATRERLAQAWSEGDSSVETDDGPVSSVLRIPRFGSAYAVPIVDGVDDDALTSGVGRMPGTAEVGSAGNVVLAGHRITRGEPFRDLPTLRPGDEILVDSADRTYTYVVDTPGDALSVPHTETWVLATSPTSPTSPEVGPEPISTSHLLTLVTCAELFHTDERLVVFAHLASDEPRRG